jgi:hypothetical protein
MVVNPLPPSSVSGLTMKWYARSVAMVKPSNDRKISGLLWKELSIPVCRLVSMSDVLVSTARYEDRYSYI